MITSQILIFSKKKKTIIRIINVMKNKSCYLTLLPVLITKCIVNPSFISRKKKMTYPINFSLKIKVNV